MVHTKDMTKEEQMEVYMKCTKKQLAAMLIESNRVLALYVKLSKQSKHEPRAYLGRFSSEIQNDCRARTVIEKAPLNLPPISDPDDKHLII